MRRIILATGIFPPNIGGPATYAKFIQDYSRSMGIDAVIVTYGQGDSVGDASIRAVSTSLPKGIRHISFLIHLIREAKNSRSPVIFTIDSSLGVMSAAAIAAALTGAKLVARITGDYAWEQGRQRFGVRDGIDTFQTRRYGVRVEIMRFLERTALRRAHRVITPSEYLKKISVGWGIDSQRITVIPNAITAATPFPRSSARKNLGINGPLIVSAGRFVPWKGFSDLIKILSSIRSVLPNTILALVGDGPDRALLEAEAKQNDVFGAVKFTGALSKKDLSEWLSAADLFVLNSSYEGLSHQLIEAVGGFRLPAVVTDIGGNAEVRDEFPRLVKLVPLGDTRELENVIINTLKKPPAKALVGMGKFSVNNTTSALKNFFETL
jgi:glycosyltransferase involved in cell wall biosynthesis